MTREPQDHQDAPVIYVIDDDKSVRDGLEDLLASVGLHAKTFASTQAFMQAERPDAPACLVLDVRMPGMGGLDFQQEMAKAGLDIPIVFITAHGDIPMSVRTMKAGAIEFLTKPFRDQDILDAINQGIMRDRLRREDGKAASEICERHASLTESERAVMALVVEGFLNKQIAARLGVSEITVKVRRGQVMRKMHAASLADLVRMADRLCGIQTAP